MSHFHLSAIWVFGFADRKSCFGKSVTTRGGGGNDTFNFRGGEDCNGGFHVSRLILTTGCLDDNTDASVVPASPRSPLDRFGFGFITGILRIDGAIVFIGCVDCIDNVIGVVGDVVIDGDSAITGDFNFKGVIVTIGDMDGGGGGSDGGGGGGGVGDVGGVGGVSGVGGVAGSDSNGDDAGIRAIAKASISASSSS